MSSSIQNTYIYIILIYIYISYILIHIHILDILDLFSDSNLFSGVLDLFLGFLDLRISNFVQYTRLY